MYGHCYRQVSIWCKIMVYIARIAVLPEQQVLWYVLVSNQITIILSFSNPILYL